MVKHIDQVPVVHVPENFPYVMPSCMAQAALEYGPIFKVDWPPMRQVICMIGQEANKLVFHTHQDHFSHEKGWASYTHILLGRSLLNMDGPEHIYYRKLMNPSMTGKSTSGYIGVINEVIQDQIKTWRQAMTLDIYEESRAIAFAIIARVILGLQDTEEIEALREGFHCLVNPEYGLHEVTPQRLLDRLHAQDIVNKILLTHIKRRRRGLQDERSILLDLLVRKPGWMGQPLNNEAILSHLRTLIAAGHETTALVSSWLLYLLATHPSYLDRVLQEFKALPDEAQNSLTLEHIKAMPVLGYAITEAARLYGPTGNLPRGVVKDFEFGGYMIPASTLIVVSVAGCHRLPQFFERPEEFDPDRFAPPREEDKRHPYALAIFGGGPHMCLGFNFAQIELKAIAFHVLHSYVLEPVTPQNIEMAYFSPDGFLPRGLKMHVRQR